ncbi:MAG: PilT/PilU family type 4a pilus ATPase [Myxococcales bacterium]|jgi:twitching motility protein PilT
MPQAPPDLIGRLAVHYQLISMQQLAAATQEQGRNPQARLGELLVQLGFINQTQLAQLLEAQRQYLAQQGDGAGGAPPPPAQPARPPAARRAGGTIVGQAPAPAQANIPGLPGGRRPRPRPPAGPAAPRQAPPRPSPPSPGRAQTGPEPRHARSGPQAQPRPEVRVDPQRLQWLHRVLARACEMDASDVHVHSGSAVKVRVYHALNVLIPDVLSAQEAESVLIPAMTPEQREVYFEKGEIDFTYAVPHVGRFRANIYNQQTGPCGCFHYIPEEPPHITDLGLPTSIARVINHSNGIVLVTGAAGSGKTSTMAALINLINEERADHILSIEDPIEYVHPSKRGVVNQREVNRHTRSFAAALHSSLREDPDVICIGELRDLETISLAMSAAETGHLVIGTLHTQGCIRTINRIIGAYPPSQQPQVRTMLSESLRAIISQKLIPRADHSGMALAYELLIANVAASNLIRENRTFQLGQVLQMGRGRGMRSMDESLMELVRQGAITKQAAARDADDPRPFQT